LSCGITLVVGGVLLVLAFFGSLLSGEFAAALGSIVFMIVGAIGLAINWYVGQVIARIMSEGIVVIYRIERHLNHLSSTQGNPKG
jgi:phage-related minor tail protein